MRMRAPTHQQRQQRSSPLLRLPLLVAAALVVVTLAVTAPRTLAERPPMPRHGNVISSDDNAVRPHWRTQFDRAQPARASVWEPGFDINTPLGVAAAASKQATVLTAYPHQLRDGEDLVVRWSAVAAPHDKDVIALTCGPTTQPRDTLFEVLVRNAEDAKDSSAGPAVRFTQLVMLRCTYTVTYWNFQPHVNDLVAIATLDVPMAESFNAPKHGHLALTANADEIAVMFNSASKQTPSVRYGLSAAALTLTASGNSTTYKASDMCHDPANVTGQGWFRDPGYMHTVILQGLALGTTYYYQFGQPDGDSSSQWSSVSSFHTRPLHADVTKFLAYADMGIASAPAATSTAVRALQDVLTRGFDDFLLHIGDISYARGQGFVWDTFFHLIEPVATRVPYMVSIGNHEYDYMEGGSHDPSGAVDPATGRMAFHPKWGNFGADSSGECAVPMAHRWHAPATGHQLFWYAFDYNNVHVIQLSSEHDWTRGSAQYQWLERDLASVDRAKTPWIVLTAHRMMYTTQLGEEADRMVSLHFRTEVEPLLWQYKVNVMLVGHQHSYERSCAVRDGKCTADGIGPVHLVIGSAGAGLEEQGFSPDLGDWSVSHINDWGYLRVEATNEQMTMQFVLNRNGAVYDEVTLDKWV